MRKQHLFFYALDQDGNRRGEGKCASECSSICGVGSNSRSSTPETH